jgi:aspartate racemase
MGPAATARFYRVLVESTAAGSDQDHVPVVIWGDPSVPDRTLALRGMGEDPVPHLLRGIDALLGAGATLLAMPCNTAHAYLAELVDAAGAVPFLDIVEETVRECVRRHGPDVVPGLLATSGTMEAELYQCRLDREHLSFVLPTADQQAVVDEAIGVLKGGRNVAAARDALLAVGGGLAAEGATALLGGCTEVALAFAASDTPLPFVDSGLALAYGVLDRVGRGPDRPLLTC